MAETGKKIQATVTRPALPQGMRDFTPEVVRKRNYIFDTIRTVFEIYGFQPLETPAMENLDTLLGKYGEEGDRLIFKVLNNGLGEPKNAEKTRRAFEQVLAGKNDRNLTERALKYDLTIPFARHIAMNHGKMIFPFRRYQIQPVWRADRPQRGRYREFYQCDADVVGSTSLINEIDLAAVYAEVFTKLKIAVDIRINSRKILTAIAGEAGGQHLMIPITTAIDKLDKAGREGVAEELGKTGLAPDKIRQIMDFIAGSGKPVKPALPDFLSSNPAAQKGLEEIRFVLDAFSGRQEEEQIIADFSLARGLDYYTGIIFEVRARDVAIGSIGGGGRYDDLTGLFGVPGLPGVGISFGVDRIYDVMEELSLFPATLETGTRVLFFNLGDKEARAAYDLLRRIRQSGIAGELYHEPAKMDRQFRYAEKRNIPLVVILGSREMDSRNCVLKDIRSGKQWTVPFDSLVSAVGDHLSTALPE